VGLTAFKLSVAAVSGSVGLLSEGVHSFLDLVSAALSFFTVREAGKPADEDHPFGHGKIETLSSLFESLLLVIAAGLIVFEGYEHLRSPAPIHHTGLAMIAMLVSLVVSFFVYRHNAQAARIAESSALHVNALHFLSDVVASLGVLAGLLLIKLTGWLIVDPLMAFAVAAYILIVSAKQVKEAILERFHARQIEAHDLRTRRSGATRHIDFHLVVCGQMSVNQSHAVCDEIELKIAERFPTASVNIHVEPCETERPDCLKTCEFARGAGAARSPEKDRA
jgi:divalent metal cation (Fe/Co/Zn/Cd) transporter